MDNPLFNGLTALNTVCIHLPASLTLPTNFPSLVATAIANEYI